MLRKLSFEMGRNPAIEKIVNWRHFIPEPYRAVCLISADFEMAWAWQYAKSASDSIDMTLRMARLERENLPKIVALCEKYHIPITWATVGHLFLEGCTSVNGRPHKHLPRLNHFENRFWKFQGGDWFDNDPCTDFKTDPEWYCPDLIRLLINSTVKHEIGNHTFSHIDCSDEICPPNILKCEIAESKKLAAGYGIELKSFVHPGYTIGNLDLLAAEGFTNFRTDYRNVLGYPKRHPNGLWELEQTMEFRYYNYWSMEYQIKRYITIIRRAIKSNTVCVLWFHPSFDEIVVDEIWPAVFRYLQEQSKSIWITTHSEYFTWLNEKG
jgi:peptidoglycan/xylan/chitin deacetylase (PgdA/CDA1 family)